MPLKQNIIISVHIPANLFTHEKLKIAFIAFVVIVVGVAVLAHQRNISHFLLYLNTIVGSTHTHLQYGSTVLQSHGNVL